MGLIRIAVIIFVPHVGLNLVQESHNAPTLAVFHAAGYISFPVILIFN